MHCNADQRIHERVDAYVIGNRIRNHVNIIYIYRWLSNNIQEFGDVYVHSNIDHIAGMLVSDMARRAYDECGIANLAQ